VYMQSLDRFAVLNELVTAGPAGGANLPNTAVEARRVFAF
jgi:hypothetical protein